MAFELPCKQRPLRYQYVPTAKGEDFRVVTMTFVAWGSYSEYRIAQTLRRSDA
jgi:DNA-binding HxlR family transcriptional regulator